MSETSHVIEDVSSSHIHIKTQVTISPLVTYITTLNSKVPH